MRRYFHSELENIKSRLVLMGERAIEAVDLAMRALIEQEMDFAEQALQLDDAIDDLEIEIDREAVRYITLRAPVASDLRLLTVAIKTSHDLERVGDEATSIAKRTLRIQKASAFKDFLGIPRMHDRMLGMLRDALDCLVEEDAERALDICRRDREVDALNKQNHVDYAERMRSDPDNIGPMMELIFISKSIERVADHATNIAEEVLYLLSGQTAKEQGVNKASLAPPVDSDGDSG